jgi:hypothetical protein
MGKRPTQLLNIFQPFARFDDVGLRVDPRLILGKYGRLAWLHAQKEDNTSSDGLPKYCRKRDVDIKPGGELDRALLVETHLLAPMV